MFTINQNKQQSFRLMKSEVRRNPFSELVTRFTSVFDGNLEGDARKALQDVKEYPGVDKATILRLLKKFHEANQKFAVSNQTESQKLDNDLASAIDSETNTQKKQQLQRLEVQIGAQRQKAKVSTDTLVTGVNSNTQASTQALASEGPGVGNLKDVTYTIEREQNKDIKKESMVALLADFDGAGGVEVENRGILRQSLFGGGKQKEVVGEAQVYELLSRKNRNQLNDLYTRLTGDKGGLPWNSNSYNEHKTRYDMDWDAQKKIVRFQRELADQASMMADISEAILGQGARMGLVAVLEGRTDELKRTLSDPLKIKEFQKKIQESGVLERDPNFMTKVVSFLIKVGIQVPLSFIHMGGFVESKDIVLKKTSDGGALQAGTAGSLTQGYQSTEGRELSGTLDILGVRLDAKWNSPAARITGLTNAILASSNPKQDAEGLVGKIGTEANREKKEVMDTIDAISASYLKQVGEIYKEGLSLKPEQQKEIMANLTLAYLSRVEAAKGSQLEGIFAAFNTAGWMLGVSGGLVETSASFSGVRAGSAGVEAQALSQELQQNKLQEWLDKAGVTSNQDGSYTLPDGKKVSTSSGIALSWNITEEVYDDRIVTRAEPVVTSIATGAPTAAATQVQPQSFTLTRENWKIENINGMPSKPDMAKLLLKLRREKGDAMTSISETISGGDYDEAKIKTIKLLTSLKKNSVVQNLLGVLQNTTDLKILGSFFNIWLEQTSGGGESRALAQEINAGKTVDISLYYEKNHLYTIFGNQYGLSSEQVKTIITSHNDLNKGTISTLGTSFKDGFQALVAYAQINGGKKGFTRLDKVSHINAQIIGEPKEQKGEDVVKQLKSKLRETLTPTNLDEYRKNLPEGFKTKEKINDDAMKAFIIDGTLPEALSGAGYKIKDLPKVYTYLAFSEGAECFNLGVAITPPSLTRTPNTPPPAPVVPRPRHTIGTGAVVGKLGASDVTFGAGVLIGGPSGTDQPANRADTQTQSGAATTPSNGIATGGSTGTTLSGGATGLGARVSGR